MKTLQERQVGEAQGMQGFLLWTADLAPASVRGSSTLVVSAGEEGLYPSCSAKPSTPAAAGELTGT